MAINRVATDGAGVPDLVRRLGEDSKRLMSNEVQLAKLELGEAVHHGGRGVLSLALAFGIGIIALVALTVLAATAIAALAGGHLWIGAVVTGAAELAAAAWLIPRGRRAIAEPSYSLEETRESIIDTTNYLRSVRRL
jgi:uncharacterized membrane protein YqjE